MDVDRAMALLGALADGVDPFTGEVLGAGTPTQHPDMVRALYLARALLEAEQARRRKQRAQPPKAGEPWSDDEDAQLLERHAAGASLGELARSHQRSRAAIEARLARRHGRVSLPGTAGAARRGDGSR